MSSNTKEGKMDSHDSVTVTNLRSLRGGTVVHANSKYSAASGQYHPACGAQASGISKLRMAWAVTTAPVTCKRCLASAPAPEPQPEPDTATLEEFRALADQADVRYAPALDDICPACGFTVKAHWDWKPCQPEPAVSASCLPCGSFVHPHGVFCTPEPDTATLDELRALADTADETAQALWDAHAAARADLAELQQQVDAMAERAEQASAAADGQRRILRDELRAAGYMMTATGWVLRPVYSWGVLIP